MSEKFEFFFNAPRVIIYPTYFSKLYLDPNYGDRSTVFTDKIQTELGQNSRPGEIDPYMRFADFILETLGWGTVRQFSI